MPADVKDFKSGLARVVFSPGETELSLFLTPRMPAVGKVTIQFNWQVPNVDRGTLYVLAVGVGKFSNPAFDGKSHLQFPAKDARSIAEVLVNFNGGLFKPSEPIVLVDEEATRKGILNRGLPSLGAKQPGPTDLVVVYFSGHGKLGEYGSDYFFFLPHDFSPGEVLINNAVMWNEIDYYLRALRCPVLVILDTCHSGTAAGIKGDSPGQEAVKMLAQLHPGMVVLASCGAAKEMAKENPLWEHGALTFAILEYLQNKETKRPGVPPPRAELPFQQQRDVITVGDLFHFVDDRVQQLSGQNVEVGNRENLPLNRMPLAIVSRAPKP